jgi:hypothetical protein
MLNSVLSRASARSSSCVPATCALCWSAPEGTWLEGKSKPYLLSEEPQKWELAKDVASFANAEAGGLIVIGVRTERR